MHGMHDEEPWTFTIIKVQGLSYLRPEKSWRPIVTFEVDSRQHHKVNMGSDGQNPNLKSSFDVRGAHLTSKIGIKVWYRGRSKKKGKKRNLVATCTHSLGDLLQKEDREPKLQLVLNNQKPRRGAAGGKPQNGAHVQIRLVEPPSVRAPPKPPGGEPGFGAGDATSDVNRPLPPPCQRFHTSSANPFKPRPPTAGADMHSLPTDKLPLLKAVVARCTMYGELSGARSESDFETVFVGLQTEWRYVGGLLIALAAIDTAVFAISSDSIFEVDPHTRSTIAASSIASGLGLSCDAWFLLCYSWADPSTFVNRARDRSDTYFLLFAISARVPSLCMFISAITLLLFLGSVAYSIWPEGVIVTCLILMVLQFLVPGYEVYVFLVRGAGVRRLDVRGVFRSGSG